MRGAQERHTSARGEAHIQVRGSWQPPKQAGSQAGVAAACWRDRQARAERALPVRPWVLACSANGASQRVHAPFIQTPPPPPLPPPPPPHTHTLFSPPHVSPLSTQALKGSCIPALDTRDFPASAAVAAGAAAAVAAPPLPRPRTPAPRTPLCAACVPASVGGPPSRSSCCRCFLRCRWCWASLAHPGSGLHAAWRFLREAAAAAEGSP